MEFDRYLRHYAPQNEKLKRQKRKNYQVTEETELKTFQSKWADLLVEEHEGAEDLRPILGLDTYDPAPKPQRLFSRYEVSSALHRNRVGYNLLFDREMQRVNSNRQNLKTFLCDQQRWLSNLKSELNTQHRTVGAGGAAANHYRGHYNNMSQD